MSENMKTRPSNWFDFLFLVLLMLATKEPRRDQQAGPGTVSEQKTRNTPPIMAEPNPSTSERQIFAARIQELGTSNNEYFRALTTSVWYYSAGFLVTAGWMFNSIKDLTSASGSLQFRDLLSRYPNLCFPVIGVFMVNVLFLNVSSGLAYVFLKGRQEIEYLRKLSGEPEFVSRRDIRTKLALWWTIIPSLVIPLTTATLLAIKFPSWIGNIGSVTHDTLLTVYALILLYYVLSVLVLLTSLGDLRYSKPPTGKQ